MGGKGAVKTKKIPMRQCTGCNERKEKKELIRVLRSPEGEILLDFTGKKNGRGAYICNSTKCLALAQKKKALERSLEIQIPEEIYQELAKEMEKHEDG